MACQGVRELGGLPRLAARSERYVVGTRMQGAPLIRPGTRGAFRDRPTDRPTFGGQGHGAAANWRGHGTGTGTSTRMQPPLHLRSG